MKDFKVSMENLLNRLKGRALGGYTPVIHIVPEQEKIIFTYASEGILVMPMQAPIFVVEKLKQLDIDVIKRLEEIAKLETLSRITFALENNWIPFLENILEKDMYIVPNVEGYEDNKEHLYIDDIPLDTDESKQWFERFLSVPEKTEFQADIYLFQKTANKWLKLEPPCSVRLFGKGTIDEIYQKQEEDVKDMAFAYPETFAVVKKVFSD